MFSLHWKQVTTLCRSMYIPISKLI